MTDTGSCHFHLLVHAMPLVVGAQTLFCVRFRASTKSKKKMNTFNVIKPAGNNCHRPFRLFLSSSLRRCGSEPRRPKERSQTKKRSLNDNRSQIKWVSPIKYFPFVFFFVLLVVIVFLPTHTKWKIGYFELVKSYKSLVL